MTIYEGPPSVEQLPDDAVPRREPAQRSGLAVASAILSVLWLWGLGSLAGVVLAHLARRDCEQDGMRGNGFRLLGLLLGYLGLVATLVVVLGGGSLVPGGAPSGTAGDPSSTYSVSTDSDGGIPGLPFGG